MKNLILTMALLLLMNMGMLYDADCISVSGQFRHLKWVCEEMQDAVVCCAEKGTWQEAATFAEEILRKNMGEESGSLVWNVARRNNTIAVKVSGKPVFLHLPLPDRCMKLSYETETEIEIEIEDS